MKCVPHDWRIVRVTFPIPKKRDNWNLIVHLRPNLLHTWHGYRTREKKNNFRNQHIHHCHSFLLTLISRGTENCTVVHPLRSLFLKVVLRHFLIVSSVSPNDSWWIISLDWKKFKLLCISLHFEYFFYIKNLFKINFNVAIFFSTIALLAFKH